MTRIRVLVVEDSPTMRRRICDILGADAALEIVGEAADGRAAIELCHRVRPDVITLDMQLPVLGGLAVTEHVMAHVPTPILIVSSSMNRIDLTSTYDAIRAGAVDVIEKPRSADATASWDARLTSAVKLTARIRVITRPAARPVAASRGAAPSALRGWASLVRRIPRVVGIGASTGGPGAIVTILRDLPPGFDAPILVVLHIEEAFADPFADWLAQRIPHPVVRARGGEPMADLAGCVVWPAPGRHLVVDGGVLRTPRAPEDAAYRPSIDVLFDALALEYGEDALACLLTGMGRDGAAGMLAIRRRGGATIAQDQASSVVYGMPREAALLGAAEHVLPLDRIGQAISSAVGTGVRGAS